MWINKYIAHTGYCSRREADKLVEEGRVEVNGALAHKTLQVFEYDNVKIDGHYITPPRRHRIYIALNKPIGVVVTTETTVEDNILESLKKSKITSVEQSSSIKKKKLLKD